MMKSRTVVVTALLAFALALAPVSSAFAWGRHGGGHYGGGRIWGFPGLVIAAAAAIITAPFAIAAAVAQAPVYYPQGPAYANAPPVYYNTPPASPGYSAAPTYYSPPQATSYYAPAPAPPQGEWYYCADSRAFYPYVRDCARGWQRVPSQPPDAYSR